MAKTSAVPTDPMMPRPARVTRVVRECRDTATLALEAPSPAPPFLPGQFNMLHVFGSGESAISISSDPEAAGIEHTIRAVGALTRLLCAVHPGDVIGVRGPFGTGWPMERARGRDVVLVAGGIGLAPLRSAIYAILARRDDFGRVSVLCGARTPEALLYAGEHERWRAGGIHVGLTVDHGGAGWKGPVGFVTRLLDTAAYDPARMVAMLCGPEVMMRFALRDLVERGAPPADLFIAMERNMKCALGFCGHCQIGPEFVCKDGPIFSYAHIGRWFHTRHM